MTTTAEHEPNDDTIEVRAVAAERLTFFADAVTAIALTLLALDVPVPTGNTNQEVLRFALDHRPEYLAYALSFLVIGAHWSSHHRVFRYVEALGGRLMGLTLLWLFMQVTTPFATRVITGVGAFQARFGFYAVIQILADLVFILMIREVQREKLHRSTVPADLFAQSYLRSGSLLFGFALSIPVSLFTDYSYVCWIAVPLLIAVGRRILRRQMA